MTLPPPAEVPAHELRLEAPRRHRWLVVVPVIDEGARLHRLLGRMQRLGLRDRVDVCVVDGGSRDGSVAVERLRALDVQTLIVKTGPGRLSAQLRCAYAHALGKGYDGVITIDGNDKDDPSAIPSFVDALAEGVDFVQGSRFVPGGVAENTPLLRHVAIRASGATAPPCWRIQGSRCSARSSTAMSCLHTSARGRRDWGFAASSSRPRVDIRPGKSRRRSRR